ncbi:Retrovirus-related Pol polyprotein from transposon RE1, partial [Linum perenne]
MMVLTSLLTLLRLCVSIQLFLISQIIQEHPSLKKIGIAKLRHGLYVLDSEDTHPGIIDCTDGISASHSVTSLPQYSCKHHNFSIWHYRLGHMSMPRMMYLQSMIPSICANKNVHCSICPCAKQKRLSFPISSSHTDKPFVLIHVDIWGYASTVSVTGHRYFLTIVDDYTRLTWVHLLSTKAEARSHLISFCEMVHTQFHTNIQIVRTDNGKEFSIPEFYASKGIIHQTTCVYTSQQNGIVERKHQHILNVTRSLLFQSYLPSEYWSFAVLHSVHLINRTPTPVLENKTPYELLYKSSADYSTLKVFGCLCYATYVGPHQSKLAPRAKPCIYLGNAVHTKGHKLMDLSTTAVFTSRDVVFYETIFPFYQEVSQPDAPSSTLSLPAYSNSLP